MIYVVYLQKLKETFSYLYLFQSDWRKSQLHILSILVLSHIIVPKY